MWQQVIRWSVSLCFPFHAEISTFYYILKLTDNYVVYLLCYAMLYCTCIQVNALKVFSFLEWPELYHDLFLGANYNIPVCLWLMDTHPYNPPMVFVRPTATMQIKQGKHVDANGKIYLPYLHEWKHVSKDLKSLWSTAGMVPEMEWYS